MASQARPRPRPRQCAGCLCCFHPGHGELPVQCAGLWLVTRTQCWPLIGQWPRLLTIQAGQPSGDIITGQRRIKDTFLFLQKQNQVFRAQRVDMRIWLKLMKRPIYAFMHMIWEKKTRTFTLIHMLSLVETSVWATHPHLYLSVVTYFRCLRARGLVFWPSLNKFGVGISGKTKK